MFVSIGWSEYPYKKKLNSNIIKTDNKFFLHRNHNKGYHIDYIFAASKFLSQSEKMNIGDLNKWLQYSDHLPISYQLNID